MNEEQINRMAADMTKYVDEYFDVNQVENVSPSQLVPYLVERGIFEDPAGGEKDLTEFLEMLHSRQRLGMIPQARQQTRDDERFWYFENVNR